MNLTIDANFIDKCYSTIDEQLTKYKLHDLGRLINPHQERYVMCPASTQDSYYSAFPSGLMYHSLQVFDKIKKLNKALGEPHHQQDLCLISFLHCFGKIGSKDEPYYIEKKSDWHNERGIWYEYNNNLNPYMTVAHRSLWWAKEVNIPLTEEQFLAILLSDNTDEDSGRYRFNSSSMTVLLQTAIKFAIIEEKQNKVERDF